MISLPINFPSGFIPLVKSGDLVSVGQIIASKSTADSETINIPQALSIKLSKVKKVLIKMPGEAVAKGDILAVSKNLFGTKKTILRSNVEGTVVKYERQTGNLLIKTDVDLAKEDIVSPIDGTIGICHNDKIFINTDKNFVSGIKSAGGEGKGEVFVLEVDDMYRIDSSAIDKIIVGHNLNREILLKGIGIGVAGMIGTAISDNDLAHIQEKNFTTPIIEIGEENLRQVLESTNRKLFIDAKTKTIIFLSL